MFVNGNVLDNHQINQYLSNQQQQPLHHPTAIETDGDLAFINLASPLLRHHRFTDCEGGPTQHPWFRPVCADVRRWLGKCGLAAPTHPPPGPHWGRTPRPPNRSLGRYHLHAFPFPFPNRSPRVHTLYLYHSTVRRICWQDFTLHMHWYGVLQYGTYAAYFSLICMKGYSSPMPARPGNWQKGSTFVAGELWSWSLLIHLVAPRPNTRSVAKTCCPPGCKMSAPSLVCSVKHPVRIGVGNVRPPFPLGTSVCGQWFILRVFMCVGRMVLNTRTGAHVFDEETTAQVLLLAILSVFPVKNGLDSPRNSSDDNPTGTRTHQTIISELGDE